MGCIPRRTRSGVDTDRIGVNVLSVFKAFSQFSSLVCFQGQLRGGSDVNMRTTRTPSDLWLNWQVRTDRDRTRSEDSRRKWKTDAFCACFFFVSEPKRELCNMSLKHHRFSCRGKKVLFRCGEARAFFHSVFSLRMDLLGQNKSSLLSQQTTAGALLKAREHSTVQRCLTLADWKL